MLVKTISFFILFHLLIVTQTISMDSYIGKGSSALEKGMISEDDDLDHAGMDKPKQSYKDEESSSPSANRRNRPSSYGSSNNFRSRTRRPSYLSGEPYNMNDWSMRGYGSNNMMSNYPGMLPLGYDNGYSQGGPSCYPLLDPQYSIFSDICGVVPQARYSLPNSFGHVDRWQVAQTLTAILGPTAATSANPGCNRSLRLLLCPLLFPPCSRRDQSPPVVPCQTFCRAVKSHCASPTLDLLPCDILPPTSELCPVNPTPYSSLLSSFIPPMPIQDSLSPVGLPQPTLSSLLGQPNLPPSFMQNDQLLSMVSSLLSPNLLPGTQGLSSLLSPPAMSPSPFNQMFNSESYMPDITPPVLVDFPLIGGYDNDFRKQSQYMPSRRMASG